MTGYLPAAIMYVYIIIIVIIREAKGLRYQVLVHGQSADIPPAAGGSRGTDRQRAGERFELQRVSRLVQAT